MTDPGASVAPPAEPSRFATVWEAEDERARTVELARKVLDNVADGIYGLDRDGLVEFANAAAARMTGYRVEELLGSNAHALLHARHPDGSPYPREQCLTFRVLQSGVPSGLHEEVFWRRDGSALPVSINAVPTFDEGVVNGIVVSFRDVSAAQEAQEQAARLREAVAREAGQRALADRLQQALLTPPPEPDHLHIVVRYLPAATDAQVGGDWYDAFLQPDGATVLVIGDVVGHDGVAAARMGQLRGVLRTLAFSHDADTPAQVLSRLERVARGLGVDSLATVVLARIEDIRPVVQPGSSRRAGRRLRWSNAGHPPPVLLHPDGTSTVLEREPDLLLGVDPGSRRCDHTADLPDSSTLLLFTDGLIERRGKTLDEGLAVLRGALADLGDRPLDELCDVLLARMSPEAGDDDLAIVAVRLYPEDGPRPAAAGPNRLPADAS